MTLWVWRFFFHLLRLPSVEVLRAVNLEALALHWSGYEDDIELSVLFGDGVGCRVTVRCCTFVVRFVTGFVVGLAVVRHGRRTCLRYFIAGQNSQIEKM
jgi:hypothetical protein